MKKIIQIFFLIFSLSSCLGNSEWVGFYYKDKNNIGDESTWTIQKGFKSIEECRNWVEDIAGNNRNYDYECGHNCKYKGDLGMYVCKTTEK